ncbi:MAG: ABC transporter permease [Bacteroidales bacterium]|nr:ABC transporter permease [Bacteroidales bacterium]MBN2764359.1 ABC transporter permease [Bacteroidales bacterium]
MFKLFIQTLQTDWIKYKKSLLPWLSMVYVIFVIFLVSVFALEDNRNPENALFLLTRNITNISAFFLPYLLVLSITLLSYIEHRSQGWKLMYTQPVGRGYFYVSKLVFLVFLILFVFLFKFIISSIAVKLLELYKHEVKLSVFVLLYPDFIVHELKIILSCSSLIAIQYWMSLRMKNFLIPTGIGTVLTILPLAVLMILGITGIIKTPDQLKILLKIDPYSLPYSFIFDLSQMQSNTVIAQIPDKYVIGSIVTGIIIGVTGFFDIRKKNIH